MLIRRHRRSVPALNTASTADISFMLLIFFLVTTPMDVDKGITRQLPPVEQTDDNTSAEVARDNIMQIAIGADSRLTVDGKPTATDGLRHRIERFVEKNGDRHLITIQTDGGASYDAYFALQDELAAAYNAVRDKAALRRFHHKFAELAPAQRSEVMDACRQHVAENYDTTTKGGQQ